MSGQLIGEIAAVVIGGAFAVAALAMFATALHQWYVSEFTERRLRRRAFRQYQAQRYLHHFGLTDEEGRPTER